MDVSKTLDLIAVRYQQILQEEANAEQTQLDTYSQSFIELIRRYARAKSTPAKALTIPAIFNRSYDENFISDYIAHILHPARNGIGVGPLEALLSLCQIDYADISLEEVAIYREYTLENGRIDLLIEWNDQLILGIENKIYSGESSQQTQSYARVMEKLYPGANYHLVYLTRDGRQASSKKFKPLSYQQLLSAFRQISVSARIDQRKRLIWDDFLEHLEVYITMTTASEFEFSEKAKLYMEHHGMLRDLERSFKEDWIRMINFLEEKVKEKLSEHYWITRFTKNQSWHQIVKPSWGPSGLSVHYEFFFDLARWEKQKIAFMVDVEGRDSANKFMEIFNKRYPELDTVYQQRGIQYLPPNRKIAIAWKEYPIPQEIEGISQVIIEAFNEFRFLETEIDRIIEQVEGS